MNNIYSLFIKAFAGGALAGISLSEGNYIFMLLGISLLWPASKNPWGGFCWGAMAILWINSCTPNGRQTGVVITTLQKVSLNKCFKLSYLNFSIAFFKSLYSSQFTPQIRSSNFRLALAFSTFLYWRNNSP